MKELLSCNDAPTEAQCTELDQDFSTRELGLVTIDETQGTRSLLHGYKFVNHPIRRIPTELMRAIFLECVNDLVSAILSDCVTDPSKVTSLDIKSAPWSLAQVSQRWRAIALDFPRLWSYIRIYTSRDSRPGSSRGMIRLLEEQIRRSSSHPLSVGVRLDASFAWDNSGLDILGLLFPTASRWQECSMYVWIYDFSHLVDIWQGSLGSLTTLHLGYTGATAWSLDTSCEARVMLEAWKLAPCLRELVMSPFLILDMVDSRSTATDVPLFDQITSYTTSSNLKDSRCHQLGSDVYKILCALPFLPNMERCTLICAESFEYSAERLSTMGCITLSRLHHLELVVTREKNSNHGITQILQHLTLPALTSLQLTISSRDIDIDVLSQVLTDFVERSQLHLLQLHISSSTLNENDILQLLRPFPSVVTLVIQVFDPYSPRFDVNLASDKLTRLLLTPEASACAPGLQQLTLPGHISTELHEQLKQIHPKLHILYSQLQVPLEGLRRLIS
ncbi:hypothetical protein C8J56DRAFT_362122 [Mycena floridula]|nr:hypothetical protein C8J56DRAFT_362122 [Mycena floridula]